MWHLTFVNEKAVQVVKQPVLPPDISFCLLLCSSVPSNPYFHLSFFPSPSISWNYYCKTLFKLHFQLEVMPREQCVPPQCHFQHSSCFITQSCQDDTFGIQCFIWEWITAFCLIPLVIMHQSNKALCASTLAVDAWNCVLRLVLKSISFSFENPI